MINIILLLVVLKNFIALFVHHLLVKLTELNTVSTNLITIHQHLMVIMEEDVVAVMEQVVIIQEADIIEGVQVTDLNTLRVLPSNQVDGLTIQNSIQSKIGQHFLKIVHLNSLTTVLTLKN